MKNNQKSLFALALSCVLFSCTNNDPNTTTSTSASTSSSYEVVSAAALPSIISSYITSKYAGSTTTEVNLNSDGTYVTYVSLAASTTAKSKATLLKLLFSAKGTLLSSKTDTSVAIADLLPAITTHISTNYSGATTTSAHSESDGSFDVFITTAEETKMRLEFTSDGTFVAAHTYKAHGNHGHNHGDNQTPVAIADLATSITSYISTTYAGATITSAHLETDGSTDVRITTSDGANLNLNFSSTGDFVSVSSNGNNHSSHETSIEITSLMTEITTYITTNYPSATITSAETDWNGGYEVHITTAAGVRLELNFTSAGVFVVGSDSNNNHHAVAVYIKDLINSIKTYLTTNYTGATITAAQIESDGSYDIYITTSASVKLKLNFSHTGTFVSVTTV